MTDTERWEAFQEEILALIIAASGEDHEDHSSSIDDEEQGLLEVLWRVYGLTPYASLRFRIDDVRFLELERKGRRDAGSQTIDQSLGSNVVRRLLEPGHQVLQDSDFQRVVHWLRLRCAVLPSDPFRGARPSPWMTNLIGRWRRLERSRPLTAPMPVSEVDPPLASQYAEIRTGNETCGAGVEASKILVVAGETARPLLPEAEVVEVPPLRVLVEGALRKLDASGSELVGRIQEIVEAARFTPALCAFGESGLPDAPQILVVNEAQMADVPEVWFAGDVHGDFLAFEAVCRVFEERSASGSKLVFLGDIVDDGFHSRELILGLWKRMLDCPSRFGWIAGNHDEALRWSEDASRFISMVRPADFEEWLNRHLDDAGVVSLARLFIRVVSRLPRALFLPGLLVSHAGFPHRDTWDGLRGPANLADGFSLGDFVWNRWANARRKNPNRTSSQSSFGSEDFRDFRQVCSKIGLRVDAMVRGHDHIDGTSERWERKGAVPRGDFEGRILTINTLSYTQRRELNPYAPRNPRSPTLARWRPGETVPTPVVVRIQPSDVSWYAPVCPACGQPNRTGASACGYPVHAGDIRACGTPLEQASRP